MKKFHCKLLTMTYYSNFLNLMLCVLWITKINQCGSLVQNSSFSKLTSTLPKPYYVMQEADVSVTPQSCKVTDDYSIAVRNSLRCKGDINASVLQELMVRGFQLLSFWAQRVKEKFKFQSQPMSDSQQQLLRLPNTFVTSINGSRLEFHNVTINHFPSQNEKISVNPLNERCTLMFMATYQAESAQTTIQGEILVNDTRLKFTSVYENATLLLSDIKTRTKNNSILSTCVSAEFNFDNFVTYASDNRDAHFLAELVTPSLLQKIIAKDPSRRIAYASIEQDVKIGEFYQRNVSRLMSSVLAHYLRSQYKEPYRLPDHAGRLPDTIEYVQIDGLNRCHVCGSAIKLARQGSNLVMRLTFSINFFDDGQKNSTVLSIRGRDAAQRNETVVLKKLLVRLEFSSPLELNQSNNLRFYVTAVRAEIIDKHHPGWFQPLKHKLEALFSGILTQIVLSWILYETN